MHTKKNEITAIEKSKLDVLLKEYDLTNTKIEKFVGNQFLYTQGALALAGGYIFFLVEGIKIIDNSIDNGSDTKLYLQFLPFFVLMILSGVLYQYQRTIGLQGYKQYLEYAINKILGQNIISYAHIGMKHMVKKNVIALMNTILYAIVYGASCFLAYIKPMGDFAPKWYIYHILAFVIFLVIAIWNTTGYTKKVKRLAIENYNSTEVLED